MAEETSIFEQSANSLALMLMGLDRTLDTKLKAFRQTLKAEEIDELSLGQALKAVEMVYDDLELDINANLERYGQAIETLFKESTEERRKRLIGPLLEKEALINDLISIAEPISNEISRLMQKPETESVEDNTDSNHLRERLSSRFIALTKTLMLLGDDDGALLEVTKALNPTPDWEALDGLTTSITDLLQRRLVEEKEKFEVYLAELNTKLKRINDIVEADSKTLDEIEKINSDFNSSINQQMDETRLKIDNQNELNLLKTDLLESLDAITSRLENYQAGYSGKLDSLHASKSSIREYIRELEQKNNALLNELKKERERSLIDPLTQLPNRLGFEKRLSEELNRSERYSHPVSIAVLDIDLFKRINDNFGHLVGDKVLRLMSKEMKDVCRGSDFLARFGGEEFILLLPQTTLEEAYIAVDKIRERIASRPFHFQNKPVPITISGGVSEKSPDEDTDAWIHRADLALYSAKDGGRNQISSAA